MMIPAEIEWHNDIVLYPDGKGVGSADPICTVFMVGKRAIDLPEAYASLDSVDLYFDDSTECAISFSVFKEVHPSGLLLRLYADDRDRDVKSVEHLAVLSAWNVFTFSKEKTGINWDIEFRGEKAKETESIYRRFIRNTELIEKFFKKWLNTPDESIRLEDFPDSV